jgi:hypothetical protein
MKRRSFLTAVLALAAWPFMRVRAHENAVKALPKRPKLTKLRFWDGKTLIDEIIVPSARPRRRVCAIVDSIDNRVAWVYPDRPRDEQRPMWVLESGVVTDDCNYYDYRYVSGPKWWEKRILDRPNLLDDIDNEVGLR